MDQTQKWLRYTVLGSLAVGVIGVANISLANGAPDIALAKLQRQDHESDWRQTHPKWNGRLYWHNNNYYFDRKHAHPAIVNNDSGTIGGGVVLSNDPYVDFSGNYGSYYPTASLDIDLGSSDRNRHARALFFQHPYFWRDGVRYDRTSVTQHGTHYYRFVRHRY